MKEIEIPYGAFDSELQEFQMRVAEGYEAEVKDGTIIIRKSKTDDEKIISRIKKAVEQYWSDEPLEEILGWLEKQGEQNKQEKDIILCHLWHDESEKCLDKKAYILFHSTYDNTWNVFTAGTVNWNVVDKWAYLSDIINIVNKDSKQSEQNPVDKVEPKFKVGQTIKKEGFNLGFTIVKIENGFYYNDMGDYFPFTDQDNCELVEQKPAWSEEDEYCINQLIVFCENCMIPDSGAIRCANWLKSLKDRVQLQNITYYNPYKEVVESIAEMCKHYDTASHSGLRDFYDNVKVKCKEAKEFNTMFPQSTWKPSDEQMLAINTAINVLGKGTINGKYLIELQEQLKKLREK